MIELLVISRLLEYPDSELMANHQELCEVVTGSDLLSGNQKQALNQFITTLAAKDLLDAQSEYGELFDRGRATSLLLFEHVHGESRDRGQAMVDLLAQYEQAGLELTQRELPDHLPLYLEYLAQSPENQARQGLTDIAPILALLSARLQQRDCAYDVLFTTLLALAGSAVDPQKVAQQLANEARDDTPDALDAVWEEEQVKFFADKGCDDSQVTAHQRRFAGAVAPQYLNISQGDQQ
ncbi:nitrate reductase molybdenum cofactor assembly chaperone [Salmonella enterica subsp. enterica serovar Choleraesuis]|nr:nitrate reductase molybdenum cofactor assembly chaperone [Salmonella enterica subsp. enterica serovar Choleraesuis]